MKVTIVLCHVLRLFS